MKECSYKLVYMSPDLHHIQLDSRSNRLLDQIPEVYDLGCESNVQYFASNPLTDCVK
jgi:hypothetical protein